MKSEVKLSNHFFLVPFIILVMLENSLTTSFQQSIRMIHYVRIWWHLGDELQSSPTHGTPQAHWFFLQLDLGRNNFFQHCIYGLFRL